MAAITAADAAKLVNESIARDVDALTSIINLNIYTAARAGNSEYIACFSGVSEAASARITKDLTTRGFNISVYGDVDNRQFCITW